MKKLLGLVLVMFAMTSMSISQAISVNGGSIQGTITDASGAVVPNAAVTVLGTDTGSSKTLTTDSAGFYSIGPLNPGNYEVDVVTPGFQKLAVKTVVRTGTVTSGNFKLTIGQSSETVEVNAGALQVNTDQAGVSDVITKEQIDTLPVNGRNFLDLAQIEPGVILQSGESFDPTKAGYSAISVSGVSGRTTRILLDGQDITDENVGTTIFNVSQGAINEFQLNRSTQDVSGDVTSTGQVLVSTNSGTNNYHGQLFYYFQDHRAVFARTAGGNDVPFQRNQFGGSVGGPIIKDKLFFFGNAERIKQDSANALTLGPLFGAIQTQYSRLPSPYRETYSTIRLDYSGPFTGHYFARVNYNVDSSVSNFGAGYELYANRDNTPGIAGGADFAKGKFTHSFRGSYEKFHNLLGDNTAGNTSVYNGIPGFNFRYIAQNLFSGPNVDAPQATYQSDKQFRYDGSWTKGAHNVRYGYSINRILSGGFANFLQLAPRATITKSTLLTGANPNDPINSYHPSNIRFGNGLGFNTEIPGFGLAGGGLTDWREGAYVSDNWKVTPSFTLTTGLRWSVDTGRANQDIPVIPCSDAVAGVGTAAPCTGSAPLLDQFQAGIGAKVHQPYANFGPQVGFAFSPGDHKTVFRSGIGIFYESDVFNNTLNARSNVLKTGLFNDTSHLLCQGQTTFLLANGTQLTSVDGISFATLCAQPIAQSAPHFVNLQKQYQAAAIAAGAAKNGPYVGNTLQVAGAYGAPYRTPYAIQYNGGVQREILKGGVLSVDYVHNSSLKLGQTVDVNHVGAARTLRADAAAHAIAATAQQFGCAGGSSSAAINCAIAAHASIFDFAGNNLDSGVTALSSGPASLSGLTPATGAAFPGINPNVGVGSFILPVGRSGYDALQVLFREQKSHPAPGLKATNFQVAYSYSRVVSTASSQNAGDQYFTAASYDEDNPTRYIGYAGLDHTHILSFGGSVVPKYGPQIGIIGHVYTAPPLNLTLNPSSNGTTAGGIFQSDATGDGTTGDIVPGTNPGDYMRHYKGKDLNKLISRYNSQYAGNLTPAGQALVNAGLFTPGQLFAIGGVQQPIAQVPQAVAAENSYFRSVDVNFSYPIRLNRFHEGLSLEPAIAFYNVGNFSNFNPLPTATGVLDGGGLNGPSAGLVEAQRVQRGSGTSDQGGARSTEFQLKLNF